MNKTKTKTKTKQLFLVPADALEAEKLALGDSFLTTIGVRECVIQVRMSVSWFVMYACNETISCWLNEVEKR